MKNEAYQNGFERGTSDATSFKKKNPNNGLPFYRNSLFGVSKYAQDYIQGYNNGYHTVLNERKKEKEAQEQAAALVSEKTAKPDEILINQALLQKMKEIQELNDLLEKSKANGLEK